MQAQVSSAPGVSFDVQSDQITTPECVRCVACRTVYEQAPRPPNDKEKGLCPSCGASAWLAAHIPVEETAVRAPA